MLTSTSLILKSGRPTMMKFTQATTHDVGAVVVLGSTPFVAHADTPAFTGGSLVDALATGGGIYTGVSDGTPVIGQDVFFNTTSKKLTSTAVCNLHFGICLAGPTGDLAGASPAADNDACDVLHRPRGVSSELNGGNSEATQSTSTTLAATQVLGGFINSAPGGAITLTLPTAANLVAGARGCKVGDSFELSIANTSGGANTITLAAGGSTLRGNTAVAQNKTATLRGLITNIGTGTEAYVVHSLVSA